ncbi:AAA+ family ATPase [Sinirhodobacter sp. HNIBRBA609]|nr:AAA+ family ATPase [Sinirhodobacter sp. HNIBRBA609]
MKQLLAPLLVVAMLASPAAAQETGESAAAGDLDEGLSLLEEGARLIFRGIMEEVGPSLDEMQQGFDEASKKLGPALSQLMALVDDAKNYEAPERLPNGDVIFRRKPGAPLPPPMMEPEADPAPEVGEEIEL